MNFKEKIKNFEEFNNNKDYIIKKGLNPILITVPHSIEYKNEDGTVKLKEPYTKAIAFYLAEKLNLYLIVKNTNKGENPNNDNNDEMKKIIVDLIKNNNILLSLDIHGASIDRNFDVELGTLNNISADFSTIYELKDAFIDFGIKNVLINNPFKGGAITKNIYGMTNADVIQIEINREFRDYNNIEKMEKLCMSLEKFINQYIDIINR